MTHLHLCTFHVLCRICLKNIFEGVKSSASADTQHCGKLGQTRENEQLPFEIVTVW